MSFLNPIMLAGLAAIAVPIIIHFLNRRRFQKVVWAAMKFLQISVEKNRRRMRIEDLILLLLRCLLLILLALALARPAILSDSAALFGQSKVTGVVILDNSYSMGMSDGASTRFARAKQAAEQVIDSMPAGSATAVYLASDMAQTVIPEPTFDLNLARQTVREAPLTDRATDLFPALNQAMDTLRARLAIRKEVYIVTDGQAAGWRQLTEIQSLLEKDRSEIQVHIILINEEEQRNLGVSGLRLASGLSPVDQPLRFEVRVSNYGAEEVRDTRVGLSLNGEPPSDEFTIDAIAPGASRSVSLFAKLREVGFHSVRVYIPEDRLAADDARALALRAIQQVRVLLVDGEPGNENRDSAVYFLEHALTPVPPEYIPGYFIKTATIEAAELSLARLDDYDAVILANVPDMTDKSLEQIEQYLRRGGGLMIFTGERVDTEFYNRELLANRQLLPAALGGMEGDASQDEMFFQFQAEDYQHPIVSIWNDAASGDLSSARVFKRHSLAPAPLEAFPASNANEPAASESISAPRDAGEPRVVLHYTDGMPAIMERDWGLGRVILFGTSGNTAWNDLPVRPFFVPIVHRALGSIIQRQDEGLNIRVGDLFSQRVRPEFLGKDATFTQPRQAEGLRDLRRIELVNGWPTLQYQETDFAGAYEVTVADPELKMQFAAQPEAGESTLDRISPAQIATLQDSANVMRWSPDFSLKEMVEEKRSGLEFWLPLVMLALALAAAETFLSQWFSRSK